MHTLNRLSFGLLLATLTSLTACSSGGGSGGGGIPSAPLDPPTVELTGDWRVTDETITASGVCSGEVGVIESYDIGIVQDGNNLTVTTPDGVFTGTISGDQMQWSGEFPEDGGITTIASMSLTATDDEFSGTVNWTWAGEGEFCQGSSDISASRFAEAVSVPAKVLLMLSHDSDRDMIVLAARHGQEWSEAEVVAAFDDGVSALFELPPGRWDIAIAAFDPELAGDPSSMQVILGYRDMELPPGSGQVLVVDLDN